MDLNNIPSIEDKVYELFADLLVMDDIEKDEVKDIVDSALEENNMDMDILISYIIEGVDSGLSMEEQFDMIKKIIKKGV